LIYILRTTDSTVWKTGDKGQWESVVLSMTASLKEFSSFSHSQVNQPIETLQPEQSLKLRPFQSQFYPLYPMLLKHGPQSFVIVDEDIIPGRWPRLENERVCTQIAEAVKEAFADT
jgi:hypothetical protein